MLLDCVYACRHPIWGGAGVCGAEDSTCSCDAGYATIDSMGSPSCVPKVALFGGYGVVAIAGAVSTLYLLSAGYQCRVLPLPVAASRTAIVRRRLIGLVRCLTLCIICSRVPLWRIAVLKALLDITSVLPLSQPFVVAPCTSLRRNPSRL